MSYFIQGNKYPPDEERLEVYDRNTRLFDGEHRQVFLEELTDWRSYYPNAQFWKFVDAAAFRKSLTRYREKSSTVGYLQFNFIRMMAEVFANLVFGHGLRIQVQSGVNQQFLNELMERSKFQHLLQEMILGLSYLGDTCFKLQKDIKGNIDIIEVAPESYFPTFDSMDSRKIVSATEAMVIEAGDKEYLLQQTHIPGTIFYAVNELKNGKLGESLNPLAFFPELYAEDGLPWVETGVDRILLYHIPNFRKAKSYWGESDVTAGILAMQAEVNNRMTQISEVLDKHARPKMIVPPGVLDKDKKIQNEALEFFEVTPTNPVTNPGGKLIKPEYVVWNAQLGSCEKEIEQLIKKLLWEAKISPIVFPESSDQIQDSGKAIEQMLLRTQAAITSKRKYITPLLKRMFFDAQLFAGLDPLPVDVSFAPSDIEKRAKEWQSIAAWQGGFQSLYLTVKSANPEESDQWIEEEIKRIANDRLRGIVADSRLTVSAKPIGTPGKNSDNQGGNE